MAARSLHVHACSIVLKAWKHLYMVVLDFILDLCGVAMEERSKTWSHTKCPVQLVMYDDV
jgi:hypothetical protein